MLAAFLLSKIPGKRNAKIFAAVKAIADRHLRVTLRCAWCGSAREWLLIVAQIEAVQCRGVALS
jgi:hypothetical protein